MSRQREGRREKGGRIEIQKTEAPRETEKEKGGRKGERERETEKYPPGGGGRKKKQKKRTSNRASHIGSLGTIENRSMSDPAYSPLPAPSQRRNTFAANEHRQHRRSRVNSTRRLETITTMATTTGRQWRRRRTGTQKGEKGHTGECHARPTYRRTRVRANSYATVATVGLTLSSRAYVVQISPRGKLFR